MAHRKRDSDDISPLQWAASAVGALLLVAVVGFLLAEAAGEDTGPAVTVDVQEIVRTAGGYRVDVRVRNDGGQAAAAVVVRGELVADTMRETSDFTLDYVPAHSEREGGLFFTADPRAGRLAVKAVGFVRP